MKIPSFSIVFLVLAAAGRLSASMMVVGGDAQLTLLLATEKTLIAVKNVSGMQEEEVFALDTKDRTVKWRFNSKRVASAALMDGTNAFYMFTDNHLQKRDIRTGVLIWSTRLDSIPQQRTPPKVTLKDRWENLLGTIGLASSVKPLAIRPGGFGRIPNSYRCKLIPSGSTLALFRDAMHSAGCTSHRCFSDWLTFDPRTGRQISGGSGDLLGDAGTVAIFEDQSSVWSMQNGKASEANFSQRVSGYSIPRSLGFGANNHQYSWNGRCIFDQQNASGTREICLFDPRKPDLIVFSAPILSDFQMNWVLLDQHLLRYSECMAYSENERRSGHPWFELYNLKGELIARTESKTTNAHWYLSFLGTTKTGKVLFNNGDERVVVGTPSLKVMRFLASEEKAPAKDAHSYTSSHMARGANCFYVTHGNITISKMATEQRPHQLRISAVDAETSRKLWEHTERVTIKKIKGP